MRLLRQPLLSSGYLSNQENRKIMIGCVLTVLLLVGPDNAGDYLQAQGILSELERSMPNCSVEVDSKNVDHYDLALAIGKKGAEELYKAKKK